MTEINNFGGNVRFVATNVERPQTEGELLDLLQFHAGTSVRVVGSLHSWSPVVFGGDALVLELSQLNSVEVRRDGEDVVTQVGAGCTVKRLLQELDRHGVTLPTVGLIDEQTVAGPFLRERMVRAGIASHITFEQCVLRATTKVARLTSDW